MNVTCNIRVTVLQVDPNCKERVCSTIPLAGVLPRTTLRERPLIRDKPPLYYNSSSLVFNACYLYRSVSVPALCCARRRLRKAVISGSCFNSAVAPFWHKTAAAVPNPAATNDDQCTRSFVSRDGGDANSLHSLPTNCSGKSCNQKAKIKRTTTQSQKSSYIRILF